MGVYLELGLGVGCHVHVYVHVHILEPRTELNDGVLF